jgi:hypothetical protein
MPYYFGEDMPGWEELFALDEGTGETVVPPNVFKYVEPWANEMTVMSFPGVPGPELEKPEYNPTNWSDYFSKDQAYRSRTALNRLAVLAAKCREADVTHVIGSYQGGNDEGFTHFHAVILKDGRRIEQPGDLPVGIDFDEFVDNAVTALMGNWGAGAYELYGAVTIDIDARTISDEKDRDTVFAAKVT